MSIPDEGTYQLSVGVKVGNADGSVEVFPAKFLKFATGTTIADAGGQCVLITPPAGGGGGGDAQTANPLSQFASTTSLQLLGVMSDETGTGKMVFATSPTLITPLLGTPASGVMTNVTGYPGDSSLVTVGTITTGTWQGDVITHAFLGTGGGAGTKFLRDDGTWQTIAGGGDALTSNPLSQFAATSSGQLLGVMSDETGTGALVFAESPVLVTPNIGSATGSISGNAGTVTTNANLTGHITSTGNAAILGSFTVAQLSTALSDATLSGNNTGDQTNIAGNAATVTTNANLTGHITSTGNAAILGSFTVAQLSTALSDATLSGNNTGDQTNISGNAGTVTTNANLTGHVTSTGNAAILGSFTAAQLNTAVSDATLALSTDNLSVFAATTSAQLLGVISDETGSGVLVFATSPTLTTPTFAAATLSGALSAADNAISRPYFDDIAEKVNAVTWAASITFDLANGNVQSTTLTAAITTVTLSNPPATGREGTLTLYMLQNGTGSYGITWPASVKFPGGVTPTSSGANKMDIYWLSTHDAGTIWYATSSLNH